MSEADERFNVYWWDMSDGQHTELRNVTADEATNAVVRLTKGPGSFVIKRCIITDSGDCINFEWIEGKVTFPPTT